MCLAARPRSRSIRLMFSVLGDGALTGLIKLSSILADVLTAWLIAWALRRQGSVRHILACGLYAFNPAVWYVSTHWGQTESVYTLFLVASVGHCQLKETVLKMLPLNVRFRACMGPCLPLRTKKFLVCDISLPPRAEISALPALS